MGFPALSFVILFLQPCGHPSFGPRQPVHNFFLCSVASVISPLLTLGQKAGLCAGPVLQNVVHPAVPCGLILYAPASVLVFPYFFHPSPWSSLLPGTLPYPGFFVPLCLISTLILSSNSLRYSKYFYIGEYTFPYFDFCSMIPRASLLGSNSR